MTLHTCCIFPVVFFGAFLAGCRSAPDPSPNARDYPAQVNRNPTTLDIQVARSGRHASMTNTTAREFGPSTVWINRWYCLPIDSFRIGETVTLPLFEFVDMYSYTFRAGGFFATENPDTIVSCELESGAPGEPATMYPLVVVKGSYD